MNVMSTKLVVLDPGHGKNTAGKRSPDSKLMEYEFNQVICNIAKDILEAHGIRVLLTKEMDDPDIPLNQRSLVAINNKADLFISVHGNAHGDGTTWTTGHGYEVYDHPNNPSKKLAEINLKHSIAETGLRSRGTKTANFGVLRTSPIPAILCEYGFFTNKEECEQMLTIEFRTKCARAVAKTALEWFGIEFDENALNKKEEKIESTINFEKWRYLELQKGDEPNDFILWKDSKSYFKIEAETMLDVLNKLGTDGWEPIIIDRKIYFRRKY